MRINTNMMSLNAWRNTTSNEANMQKALEKLSSGNRINRAADDAAGLAVSENMGAQIRGLNQAGRNAQDGIALVQTAEGGAGQIQGMLQRMRELTVQSSNGALADPDRAKLNTEFQSLISEIDRTAGAITYNNIKLLAGTTSATGATKAVTSSNAGVGTFSVGGTGTAAAGVNTLEVTQLATAGSKDASLTVNTAQAGTGARADSGYTLSITVGATTANVYSVGAGATIDKAAIANSINTNADLNSKLSASYDAGTGKLTVTSKTTGSAAAAGFTLNETYADGSTAAAAADSLFGASAAAVTGQNASYKLNGGAAVATAGSNTAVDLGNGILANLSQIGTTQLTVANQTATNGATTGTVDLTIQVGANSGDTLKLSINAMGKGSLGIGSLGINNLSAMGLSGDGSGTNSVLNTLDSAINNISSYRANLGAIQNRLTNITDTLSIQSENLTGAQSRIRDVDMGSEMAQYTKYNVLQQASTSMLAQANQSTQGVLSLLR